MKDAELFDQISQICVSEGNITAEELSYLKEILASRSDADPINSLVGLLENKKKRFAMDRKNERRRAKDRSEREAKLKRFASALCVEPYQDDEENNCKLAGI